MRYNPNGLNDATEITVLQLPKFKAEATELIGTDGIELLAVYLIERPDAGVVIPGTGGARKVRWAAKRKGKRGGARIIYVYVVVAQHLPDPLLRQECQVRLDARREEGTAAYRGSSERSAIECERRRLLRRALLARTLSRV